MIIDSHIHLDNYSERNLSLAKRLENLKKIMKQNNIAKAVIIASMEEDEEHPSMEVLLKLLEKEKNLFLVGTISITKSNEKKLRRLNELLSKKKIIGIKLYPGYEKFYPYDKTCDKIYDLCEKYNVPVIFHTGETFGTGLGMKYAKPEHIDEVAVKRPKLKIVMAHLGNPWINDTMVILSRNKNVYADISGLVWKSFDKFQKNSWQNEIIKILKFGVNGNKLIFGTDWPCNEDSTYFSFHKDYINFVNSLKISKEDKNKIFCLNAEKLFKL